MKGLLVFGVLGFLRRQATPVVLDLGGRLQVFHLGSTADEVQNTSNVSNTSNASAGSCTSQSCGAGEFCGFAPTEGGAQRSLCKPCAECVEPADSVTFDCAACEGYYANVYYQPESVHTLSDEELDEFYRYLGDNHTLLPRERARECQEKAGVEFQWAGDGLCDDQTNIEACAWDNGDCCEQPDKPVKTMYCDECHCKDPQSAHFGTKSEPTSRYYYAPGYTDYYDTGIVHHSQDMDEDEAFVYGLKEVFNPCRALEPACRECHENIGHDDSHVWEEQEQCHKTLHCDGTCDACDSCDWWSEDCESKCASCWEAQRACHPCDSSCSSYESCLEEVSGLRSVPAVDDHDICYAPCSECRQCTYEKENATELALCFKRHADAGKCQSCIQAHQSLQIAYTEHMSQCMEGGPCDAGVLESIAKNATERCAPCWESSVWQDCDPCAGQCEGCETCYDSKTAQMAPTHEVAEAQEEPPMACESECGACGQCVATLGDQSEEAKQICEPLRKEACAECDECWAHPPGEPDPPVPVSIQHEAQRALEAAWTERCTALCEKRCWAEPIDDLLASCYCEHDACCEPCLPCRSCTARMEQPHLETALVHAPKNGSHIAKLATVQRANVTRVTAAKLHVVRAFKARRARRATRTSGTSSNATVPAARHRHKKHPRPEVLSDLVAGHSRARRGLHVLFKSSSSQVNGTLLSRVLGAESRRARC